MSTPESPAAIRPSTYAALIEKIFFDHFSRGSKEVIFDRQEIYNAANELGLKVPKNLGDTVYSFRYRRALPDKVLATQPKGMEWIIEGIGHGKYAFKLTKFGRIEPNENLVTIKVPDATPEIITKYALSDEQALLAVVRYNRLVDIFLGIASYSLQSHLRTTVDGIGQIEIDEVYVGLDRGGRHYVVPVQAKGGSDKLGATQTRQDIAWAKEKFPSLICRTVSAQFMSENRIAMFELTTESESIKIVDEAHYQLVPSDSISIEDLGSYAIKRKR